MSYEFEVSSPKVQGVTAIYFILFFFAQKTLWWAPYQDLFHHFIVSQLELEDMNMATFQHNGVLPKRSY